MLGVALDDVLLVAGVALFFTWVGPWEPLAKLITRPAHTAVATTAAPTVIHATGSRRRIRVCGDGDGQ